MAQFESYPQWLEVYNKLNADIRANPRAEGVFERAAKHGDADYQVWQLMHSWIHRSDDMKIHHLMMVKDICREQLELATAANESILVDVLNELVQEIDAEICHLNNVNALRQGIKDLFTEKAAREGVPLSSQEEQ